MVSSADLGKMLGLTPEQIRKDLLCYGQFGRSGVGYTVHALSAKMAEILGLGRQYGLVVIGLGHLGSALVNYRKFAELGFCLRAIFDVDSALIGSRVSGVPVYHLDGLVDFAREHSVHIGVIAVPEQAAQGVADKLVAAGVKGIWNFAPCRLAVPNSVRLVNEDITIGLNSLSYHLAQDAEGNNRRGLA